MGLLNRVEHKLVRPALRWVRPSRHVNFAGIDISYRSELDGGEPISAKNSFPFSDRGECQNKSASSNGAADLASSASQCLPTVFVTLFAYPTSTRRRFPRANTRYARTNLPIAFPFINPTI
jgi:hypothetical protein